MDLLQTIPQLAAMTAGRIARRYRPCALTGSHRHALKDGWHTSCGGTSVAGAPLATAAALSGMAELSWSNVRTRRATVGCVEGLSCAAGRKTFWSRRSSTRTARGRPGQSGADVLTHVFMHSAFIGARLPRPSGRLVLCRLHRLYSGVRQGWWNRGAMSDWSFR